MRLRKVTFMEQKETNEDNWGASLPPWTLVTSHGLALLFVATHPDATVREIAAAMKITERRVAAVIRDLTSAKLVSVKRQGRRNQYTLNPGARFRHPLVADIPFRAFVSLWRRSTNTDS